MLGVVSLRLVHARIERDYGAIDVELRERVRN
jgi:hypothetical protein